MNKVTHANVPMLNVLVEIAQLTAGATVPASTQQCYVLQVEYASSTAILMVGKLVGTHSTLVQEEETVYLISLMVTELASLHKLHVKKTVLVTYTVQDHLPAFMANAFGLESLAPE